MINGTDVKSEKAEKTDKTTVRSVPELMELLSTREKSAAEASNLFAQNVFELTGKRMNEPVNVWDVVKITASLLDLQNQSKPDDK